MSYTRNDHNRFRDYLPFIFKLRPSLSQITGDTHVHPFFDLTKQTGFLGFATGPVARITTLLPVTSCTGILGGFNLYQTNLLQLIIK